MLREEDKNPAPVPPSGGNWRTYSRSVSWTERPPPRKPSASKPQWNSKARACLPPLQPLSITRPNIDEWPRAGSDDVGVWPNPPVTPGGKSASVTPREYSGSGQPPIDFECMKEKLAFFDKECSRILDYIYLGSEAIAKNREVLRLNKITHVLNCVGFVCPEYFNDDLVYKTLWLQDCPTEDITSILYDVFDYFEDVREQKGRVLVHCCKGVSRSTSMVIAYLMWKEGRTFDDAFELVKAARRVANPNVGFACQLLQCQKRVHALPPSPSSVLRMYRMAPHSPYAPLHLVPKMLCEPATNKLDSRGAYIIHVPSALYVWIGKNCSQMMSDNAMAAASQIVRYEKVQCPVSTVKDGEESTEFWYACSFKESSQSTAGGSCVEEKLRKVDEYDLDFEIFHRALAGGVVPPLPVFGVRSETCLPARENGWCRLRRKFANGTAKQFVHSSKSTSNGAQQIDNDLESGNISTASSSQSDSPGSFYSCASSWNKSGFTVGPLSDIKFSRSASFSLVESFPSLRISRLRSTFDSPSISPLTSDNSSSYTASPASSKWSDLSFVSAQSSPDECAVKGADSVNSDLLGESIGSVQGICSRGGASLPSPEEAISADYSSREKSPSSNCGGTLPEHSGTVDESSQVKS